MSRAFVSEGDGWAFCRQKMQSCMFASEKGTCVLRTCKVDGSPRNGKSADKTREEGAPEPEGSVGAPATL